MKPNISLKHSVTTFPKRMQYYASGILVLACLFLIIYWFDNNENNVYGGIIILALLAYGYFTLIYRSRKFIADFQSDSNNVSIRYFIGKNEFTYNSQLSELSISIKNTTTRFGFDCELRLTIEDKKFIIDDTFDWSLMEMKTLFEYIKHFKQESLSEKEKDNLLKIEEKWSKEMK